MAVSVAGGKAQNKESNLGSWAQLVDREEEALAFMIQLAGVESTGEACEIQKRN